MNTENISEQNYINLYKIVHDVLNNFVCLLVNFWLTKNNLLIFVQQLWSKILILLDRSQHYNRYKRNRLVLLEDCVGIKPVEICSFKKWTDIVRLLHVIVNNRFQFSDFVNNYVHVINVIRAPSVNYVYIA